jgi:hypothetical protein
MAYTNIDDPSAHFQAKTYTGTSGIHDVTLDGNSDMQPDFVWFKNRDVGYVHQLYDSSRGVTKALYSNGTNAEATITNGLTQFHTDGFRVTSAAAVNENSMVCWNWHANSGTTSSNTDGDITSTVQVNSDANFSIVTYTGNFTATQTVGHGLGVRPDVVIIKNRSGANDWVVWTSELTSGNFMKLNATDAQSSSSRIYQDGFTTSTFGIGANNTVNKNSNNYVAYCFNNVQGYSKFGKYVGNGNDNGPFVYTGFKPAWIMVKNIDSGVDHWHIIDNKRNPNNVAGKLLFADLTSAEITYTTETLFDILSNGFKLRGDYDHINKSGENIIYMAFAENPFTTSTGIPTTAR